MKVSIILPVYNGEETLKECLEAILNIDYPKTKYFWIIPFIILFPLTIIILSIFFTKLLLYLLISGLFLLLGFLLYKGFTFLDFISILLVGPFVYLSFGLGVIKGIYMKVFDKF